MNFFEQQDQARKTTRWLVFLFVLAVLSLVLLSNLLLIFLPSCFEQTACLANGFNWRLSAGVSALIVLVILAGSIYKHFQLAKGAKYLAEAIGAVPVSLNEEQTAISKLHHRRLMNVVEEMALASHMPVPLVYVLDDEPNINAFAAGFSQADAVIVVTEGLLETLGRDELQGVIAHEFSHIANGDMRLNMRLTAILHGILFISELGWLLLRGGRTRHYRYRRTNYNRSRSNQHLMPTLLSGIALVVIGYLGVFFGNLIKASVSRQREFLADASAVQFTRNNQGIADALKQILHTGKKEATLIETPLALELSHFFFCKAVTQAQSLFDSHPPLVERIYALEPNWDGTTVTTHKAKSIQEKSHQHYEAQKQAKAQAQKAAFEQELSTLVSALVVADQALETQVQHQLKENLTDEQKKLIKLKHMLEQPISALTSLIYFWHALQENPTQTNNARLDAQIETVFEQYWPSVLNEVKEHWRLLSGLHLQETDLLPMLDLAVVGLRQLSKKEYAVFQEILLTLIKQDKKIDLYEWCLFYSLKNALDAFFFTLKPKDAIHSRFEQLHPAFEVITRKFAISGHASINDAYAAYSQALEGVAITPMAQDAFNAPTMKAFLKAVSDFQHAFSMVKAHALQQWVKLIKHDDVIEPIEKNTVICLANLLQVPAPEQWFDA